MINHKIPDKLKLQIRLEAIPLDVAESMAFEREPVSVEKIREILDRAMPRAISRQPSVSSATLS